MENYRDIGNECKRGPYTYDTFYTSQIIHIRSDAKRQNSNKTLQKLSCSQEEALLICKVSRREREKKEESEQQEFGLF